MKRPSSTGRPVPGRRGHGWPRPRPERCRRRAARGGLPWVTPWGSLPAGTARGTIQPRGIHRARRARPQRRTLDVFVSASKAGLPSPGGPRALATDRTRSRIIATIGSDRCGGLSLVEPARPPEHCGPVARGVFAEMLDAFQHDRAGVTDGIESAPPFGPIDRAVAGRAGERLAGRYCRGRGSSPEASRPPGSRAPSLRPGWRGRCRVPGQAADGPVRGAARPGRPSGCRDARPAACSRRRSSTPWPRACSASRTSPRARAARRSSCSLRIGQSAGMDDQAFAAGGGQPVDASLQVVDRLFVSAPGRSSPGRRAWRGWPGRPSSRGRYGSQNPRLATRRASTTGSGKRSTTAEFRAALRRGSRPDRARRRDRSRS